MHPRAIAKKFPDQLAAIMADGSGSITYRELENQANQGANFLRSLGIENGDAISIWLPNCIDFFVVYWAAQRAGLYICPISTQLTAEDAAYIFSDSGSKLVVTDRCVKSAGTIIDEAENQTANKPIILERPQWTSAISEFSSRPITDEKAGNQMVYSSGTTGKPKGVWTPLEDQKADAPINRAQLMQASYGFDEHSVLLAPAPLYHTAPLIFSTIPQRMGATIVLMHKFDAEEMLRLIATHKVTFVQMVPTMFIRLLKLPESVRQQYDISSLTHVLHAAAPCPIETKRQMLDWFGPIIYEYYAGSEGNGSTAIGPEEWLKKPGSVGKAQGVAIHICDEKGQELLVGEDGLIYFAGGKDFEYLNDPQKTKDARHPKHPHWSTLGDIGHIDEDGYLFLTDRKSFMIISGGVNIYPQEIENLLVQHPDIDDVAVIGVPNPDMGEEVKALVQPKDWERRGEKFAASLIEYCRANLAHYKCPQSVDFERKLPRHETGKLYKQQLRKRYWA